MWKQSQFTHTTRLPPDLPLDRAVALLHRHEEIIRLNPLVVDFRKVAAPVKAPIGEASHVWYELTDRVELFLGIRRHVTYHAGFLDTPDGVATHVYAPAGLEIRESWSVRDVDDSMQAGLELVEDGEMTCNVFLVGMVRRNLDSSHKAMTEKLIGERGHQQAAQA